MGMAEWNGELCDMDLECPVSKQMNLQAIQEYISCRMWANISEHEANPGLERGIPCIATAKKLYKRLLAEGHPRQAKAFQACVIHGTWGAARASNDPRKQLCPWCGMENETLLHRYWACPE